MSDELSSPETAARVHAYLEQHPVASIRAIGRDLGIGRSTALRAVRRLLEEGRVSRERLGTGKGYPSRYADRRPVEATPAASEQPRRRTRRGRRARKRKEAP